LASRIPNSAGATDANSYQQGNNGGTLTSPDARAWVSATAAFTGTAQGGTSTAFGIVQPTIIVNKLLRII
jgi:hypothetical protein